MRRHPAALLLGTLLLLTPACGSSGSRAGAGAGSSSPSTTTTTTLPSGVTYDPKVVYTVDTTVLENPSHGPEACFVTLDSYPPQCGGLPVVGLSWDAVPAAAVTRSGKVTWAGLRLTGTYDGHRLTLTRTPTVPPKGRPKADPRFPPACPTPTGGWKVTDASKVGADDWNALQAYASGQPDFVTLWLDQTQHVAGPHVQYAPGVVTVAFTGDLARHEREVRDRWGGAVCVVVRSVSHAALRAAQARIQPGADGTSPAGVLSTGESVADGTAVLDVHVTVDNPSVRAWLQARTGTVPVRITAWLTPVTTTEGDS